MKIQGVEANNRKKVFEVRTVREHFNFPYAKLDIRPSAEDPVAEVFADPETGREAFTYRLESGAEDTVHLDVVREYHEDPSYLNEVLLHKLTVAAREAMDNSGLAKREIVRRLGTSATQLYRLLDLDGTAKSAGQLIALLHLLGREVEVTVRPRVAESRQATYKAKASRRGAAG